MKEKKQSDITSSRTLPPNKKNGISIVDNRSKYSSYKALINNINDGTPIQRIHIGLEPTNPDTFRTVTRCIGSTTAHFGFGDFNIHTGVYNSNLANNPGVVPNPIPATVAGGISDNSNQRLIDRTNASNYIPEIDHIVPRHIGGSNSYSNARVLSKYENNNDAVVTRPSAAQTSCIAHKSLRIRDIGGYDHSLNARDTLNADDITRINNFGGLLAAVGANSGTTQNNVNLAEG